MFTYCFIDKYDIETPIDFAYNRDLSYLESRVASGEFKKLIILKRFF